MKRVFFSNSNDYILNFGILDKQWQSQLKIQKVNRMPKKRLSSNNQTSLTRSKQLPLSQMVCVILESIFTLLLSGLAALAKAIELAVPDADISTVCQTVDSFIEDEVKKVFASKKSKKLERGIAFPTCISVNHVMGHYSPLEDEST